LTAFLRRLSLHRTVFQRLISSSFQTPRRHFRLKEVGISILFRAVSDGSEFNPAFLRMFAPISRCGSEPGPFQYVDPGNFTFMIAIVILGITCTPFSRFRGVSFQRQFDYPTVTGLSSFHCRVQRLQAVRRTRDFEKDSVPRPSPLTRALLTLIDALGFSLPALLDQWFQNFSLARGRPAIEW